MKRLAFVLAVLALNFSLHADEPVPACHRVNAPVGLVIRAQPSTTSKRLGALEEGLKVTLAGNADAKGLVTPVISKDAQEPDMLWVQISKPKAGYVLYRFAGTSPYDYLVPCTK